MGHIRKKWFKLTKEMKKHGIYWHVVVTKPMWTQLVNPTAGIPFTMQREFRFLQPHGCLRSLTSYCSLEWHAIKEELFRRLTKLVAAAPRPPKKA